MVTRALLFILLALSSLATTAPAGEVEVRWAQAPAVPELAGDYRPPRLQAPDGRSVPGVLPGPTGIGYVACVFDVEPNAKWKSVSPIFSTVEAGPTSDYIGAVTSSSALQFKPAMLHSRPIRSSVTATLLLHDRARFNPVEGNRWLLAHVAYASQDASEGEPARDGRKPPRSVLVRFTIAKPGRPAAVEVAENVEPRWAEAATAAASRWRFAAARPDRPLPSPETLVLPVAFPPPPTSQTAPKVLRQFEPEYPRALKAIGIGGDVLVGLTVGLEGEVENAEALEASHPLFAEAAIASVLRWQFSPGKIDGKPARFRFAQPILFRAFMGQDVTDLFSVSQTPGPDMPEHLRWDEPPTIRSMTLPALPKALASPGPARTVETLVYIDPLGQVLEARPHGPPDPVASPLAAAILERWRFSPARRQGQTCAAVVRVALRFGGDPEWNAMVLPAAGRRLLEALARGERPWVEAPDLDAPLRPISTPDPIYPKSLGAGGKAGEAVVRIFIDPQGRVLLPDVVSATEPAFGAAALVAISQWRFRPPTVGGVGVFTRAEVPVGFEAPDPATP